MWNNNPNNKQSSQEQRYSRSQQQGGPIGYQGWQQGMGGYAGIGESSMVARSSLARKVMAFTFFSILAAMAGCYVGMGLNLRFGGGMWLLFFILEIGLIFATAALKDKTPINFVLLYSFAAVTGLAISPLIDILTGAGYSGIVFQALGITAGLCLALTVYAWTTKRDFSGIGPFLFIAVIGLLLVGLLNFFIRSELLHMVYLYAGVIIFSGYMLFDVQQVKKYPDTIGNAVMLSINIYLNIYNLFLFILQLLMASRD